MININGVQIRDYRFDNTVADTVFALHGIGGSANSFVHQASLATDHLNFLAWDMPGYQGTELLQATTFESLANCLHQVINELGLKRVHLLGHSIGGMLAIELAIRSIEQIVSLGIMGSTPAFGGKDERFKQQFLQARLAPLDEGVTMATMAESVVPEITGSDPHPDTYSNAMESMRSINPATYRAIVECLITFDRRDKLSELTLPCCLIAGGEDSNAPAKTMKKMADTLPHAEYHEIENAGHLLNLEKPDPINRILHTFYQRVNS